MLRAFVKLWGVGSVAALIILARPFAGGVAGVEDADPGVQSCPNRRSTLNWQRWLLLPA